jgi:ABC-type multidrug transport system ATPase subunit
MRILLTDAGKRYNREWIFRHVNYEFLPGSSYAITGPNGSGKSTLLQVLSGAIIASEGSVSFYHENSLIPSELQFREITICAPYLELIEEMSALEFLQFHSRFKPFLNNIEPQMIISMVQLDHAADKQIRYFSSGMKQRIKIAQAILTESPVVLLDEPCTNLDTEGIKLYLQLIRDYSLNRCIIVSSNDETEYSFCQNKLDMNSMKPSAAM